MHSCNAISALKKQYNISRNQIKGIGISYQLHGIVMVDKNGKPLRKSNISCNSRTVEIGKKVFDVIGHNTCASQLLNSPSNFTASKLIWVKENEPDMNNKIHKFMLPGDFITYKLSNTINTIILGLSEGIFLGFKSDSLANFLLKYYGIDKSLVPDIVETFSVQFKVDEKGEVESGIASGTSIFFRTGDQSNYALSVNVFNSGVLAVTGDHQALYMQ